MEIINKISELQAQVKSWHREGEVVAFVPTMGNLHGGHFALVERAHEMGTKVIVSIFVNPAQFDRKEDLVAYPMTMDADCESLEKLHTDVVFAPVAVDMYPSGALRTKVEVPGISDVLEGEKRTGHFIGVATVVSKLFNLVQPDIAIFGEKDFQQLLVIRQMVNDLNMNIQIEGVEAVRDEDGLAKSSRNSYLTPEERDIAPVLQRTLQETISRLSVSGEWDAESYQNLQQEMMGKLDAAGFRSEYLEVRRNTDLQPPAQGDKELVVLVSAWLGKARLIDNVQVVLK
uniref:Pantothenate synthetase n=1 Tax=uncultured Thiotrichaceae bacterium TaxID=298394 RepID=A0A6S6UKC9_9GAMM|nr:MAG: Pantoate--beta-alanine ligase (EC [uncultured Thiotrichaceae bacterium]